MSSKGIIYSAATATLFLASCGSPYGKVCRADGQCAQMVAPSIDTIVTNQYIGYVPPSPDKINIDLQRTNEGFQGTAQLP